MQTRNVLHWREYTNNKLLQSWKSIDTKLIVRLAFANLVMASGTNDGTVRLWSFKYHTCTHKLKGIQGVISSGRDRVLILWDLSSNMDTCLTSIRRNRSSIYNRCWYFSTRIFSTT